MADRSAPPVLEVRDLKKHFPIRTGLLQRAGGTVFAVDGVSFSISAGETLGLVGESGCGKSTVGRTILRLIEPTGGSIRIDGRDITKLSKTELRPYRRQMQIIFQDPFSSLDPRMSAGDIVAEPMRVHRTARGADVKKRVAELFDRVGLRKAQMENYPHQFSGGQRQRIGIARALALQPKLIIGDEPVSALDVSIQAQVLNLMMDLQREMGLAYLFISHNLAVVEHLSHNIAVMYLGRIVEYTDKRTLFTKALHPYTESLLLAVPVPDPRVKRVKTRTAGRRAEPDQPAVGLPLPHPLPLRGRALPHGTAGLARGQAWAIGRLSFTLGRHEPAHPRQRSPRSIPIRSPRGPRSRAPSAWSPRPIGSPPPSAWRRWKKAATPSTPRWRLRSRCRWSSRISTGQAATCRSFCMTCARARSR